jgi:hypothetical protein
VCNFILKDVDTKLLGKQNLHFIAFHSKHRELINLDYRLYDFVIFLRNEDENQQFTLKIRKIPHNQPALQLRKRFAQFNFWQKRVFFIRSPLE